MVEQNSNNPYANDGKSLLPNTNPDAGYSGYNN